MSDNSETLAHMADRIVVPDSKRVVEADTRAGRLASGGEYAKLFTLQAEGYR
jgi:ATP-binding cassette, subfamily B, bacterial